MRGPSSCLMLGGGLIFKVDQTHVGRIAFYFELLSCFDTQDQQQSPGTSSSVSVDRKLPMRRPESSNAYDTIRPSEMMAGQCSSLSATSSVTAIIMSGGRAAPNPSMCRIPTDLSGFHVRRDNAFVTGSVSEQVADKSVDESNTRSPEFKCKVVVCEWSD
jgi:hypothetical protein